METLKKIARVLVYFSRIVVGSVFVVSGLIKANDTLGFSYKLEEYFEPNALGEFFHNFYDFSLPLAIIVCVAEVVLGLSLIFGTKYKLTILKITGFLIFFGFLTYYTAQCDPHEIVTYTNEAGDTVTSNRQCVLDCGCFGDALKGSLGRSLTPWESFKKDMILLFLTIFLFFGWKTEKLNNERKDKILIGGSLVFTAFFGGYVFGWWMPLSFMAIASFLYLLIKWFYVKKGREWIIISMLIAMSGLFVWYTLTYLPVKDYRPYAIGNNLPELMKSSDDYKDEFRNLALEKLMPQYQSQIEATLVLALAENENYNLPLTSDSLKQAIKTSFEEEITYKYEDMAYKIADSIAQDSLEKANLTPSVYSTLYYLQNKETGERGYYKSTQYMEDKMWEAWEYVYILVNKETGKTVEIEKSKYKEEDYPGFKKKSFPTIVEKYGYEPKIPQDFRFPDNDEVTDQVLYSENYVLLVVSWDLDLAKAKSYARVNLLYNHSLEKDYSFYAATSKLDLATSFVAENKLDFSFISADDKILKTIVRSNPGVLLIKGGIVLGKWGKNSVPTPEKLEKYISKLK